MMKNCIKRILLTGVVISTLSVNTATFAQGSSLGAAIALMTALSPGLPVFDFTSVPAHTIVHTEQALIQEITKQEAEIKKQIKDRVSKTVGPDGQQVDAKLSAVKINSAETNQAVAEGLIAKSEAIEQDAKTTPYELAKEQMENMTSRAGTLTSKEAYAQKRKYDEQEQNIRLLSEVLALKGGIDEKLKETKESLKRTYSSTTVESNLSGGGTVAEGSDYNQSLRQYAYNGLVYDQLLSLEQQILGLRVQVKATKQIRNAEPLTDVLEVGKCAASK